MSIISHVWRRPRYAWRVTWESACPAHRDFASHSAALNWAGRNDLQIVGGLTEAEAEVEPTCLGKPDATWSREAAP